MLRDTAHLYKDKYAEEIRNDFSLRRFALTGFLRYVAPVLLMLTVTAFAVYSEVTSAAPQGFTSTQQRAAPHGFGLESSRGNTVRGIIDHARDEDYVVLRGCFVRLGEQDGTDYIFADDEGDRIGVTLLDMKTPVQTGHSYYLWARVNSSLLGTGLDVIEYIALN